ncbi:Alpha/Beta hydrolase protein [Xylaria bambusicola]|uniref:Alpha/Beta hydrolase protein n=1 Tax=Xylaria bambusicola TaxID=326684 RepID=UPI0020086E01|nr:Alpha/Beta hydrolase protein [Xylaria bambusicola]KAI0515052.1 Alpha/Beta hydrolase protein [Xylaria bambusicola]
MMALTWSKQPLKGIFIAFHIFKTLAFLPWLLIRYTPKSARPFPEWSLKRCVLNPLVRQLLVYYTVTKSTAMSLVVSDQRKAKERYALAEPANADLYSGVLASDIAKPAPVGGIWYPTPVYVGSPNLDDEKVVLHFPGGGFVLAFGQEMYGKGVASAMSKYLNANRTFYAQYRVATDDATRFPAALQDLVTFYNYILSLGVKPSNIILSGDSAAGNLVIALLRYLETSPKLPLPRGAIVWSPWVHVTLQAGKDFNACRNTTIDSLTGPFLQWGAEAYFPKHEPPSEELAYISPLHHPFRTRVPLIVHAGGAEAFYDTIEEFAKQMNAIDGNNVQFYPSDLVTHNLILAYGGAGLEHEVESVLRDISSFLKV